jgi:hypothetical protein
MSPSSRRAMRGLVAAVTGILVSACGSLSGNDARGQILVVDNLGAPLQGAVVLPDPEFPPSTSPNYTESELKERSTNAQGIVQVYLDDFYWNSDSCYHIRVHRAGFEDEAMTVSRDLLPAVLKIDMRPRATAPPQSGPRRN